jgi:malate synthase
VAHPDLVPVVQEVFDRTLGERAHQKERRRDEVRVGRRELLDVGVPGARITAAGLLSDVSVALQYLEAWLRGSGAVAINNMMEDTATAEIARAQLWQWVRHGVSTEDGQPVTLERVRALLAEERRRLESIAGAGQRLGEAAALLDALVSAREFPEFLTLGAYEKLE